MPSEKSLSHEQPTTSRSTEQSETIEELTSSFSSLSNVSPSVSNSSRGAAASAASLTPPIAQGNHKLKRGPRIANQTRINKWLEFMQLDEIERPSNVCQRLSCQNLTPVECVNKQQVLNDWLQSTAQSKHLPTSPKAASAPLGDLVEPPADAAAIPLTAIPVVRTLSNSNANIPRFNIDHNRNTFKKPQMAAPLSAAEKRLQERRMRREQRSPATFLARPNLAAHDDDDASFFQELLDSLAKNKQKSDNEMPFDLQCKPERSEDELCPRQQSVNAEASQATSGDSEVKQSFNLEPSQATSAVDVDSELELLPTQQSFSLQASQATSVVDSEVALRASCQSFNLAVSLTKQTDSLASSKRWDLITERRQHQRLNRSLQSDTMLEMLSLPSQQLPASSTQSTPTVLSFMDPGGVYSSQALSLADTGNESLSSDQTVFRPQETLSTKRSQLTWDCASSQITANNAISSKAQQTGLATPATACEFADSQSVHSLPPLDMDATQESQESMFVLEKRNDDTFLPDRGAALAAQRPDKMFAKGNAQHLNVEVDLKFMPPSVQKLYTLICGKFSDYAFVYALSAQLSQDCVPMECYVYLKMALLISLVSIELDELRPPISLCVICNDSCATNRLLNSVGQLAPRFIGPHEGGQLATFSALPARYNWLQASPLMMAQQGVYYAGDWNRLSRPQAEELEKVIENNTLTVPQLPQSELPLETAIWTYWQPEKAVNQTTAFAKLCPIFGLPIYVDEPIVNSSLWNFVLHAHSRDAPKGPDTIRICSEDMRTLLELIQQRQVVFTEPAEQLLKRYYVISRVRQSTAFSSKTYIVLKQFAESVAKLAMRLDVLESDVVVAIFHCENFVRNIFGAGDLPPPPVASFNVISRVDAYMNIFTRWLFQYLDNYEQKLNQ